MPIRDLLSRQTGLTRSISTLRSRKAVQDTVQVGLVDDLHDEERPIRTNLESLRTYLVGEPLAECPMHEDLVLLRSMDAHAASMTELRRGILTTRTNHPGESTRFATLCGP